VIRSAANTDEELAKMIGYVRAVVNRHMQHFKKEGTIETHRNYLAVRDLHGWFIEYGR